MPSRCDQVMVNEILRGGAGAGLVEGHHHGAVEPRSGQQPQLVGLVGEAELGAVRAEKAARMRLEGHGKGRLAVAAAHLQGGRNDGAVAEMDTVEIAHGDHRPPGDRVRRGGVADNGKTICHCRHSWQRFCTVLGRASRQASVPASRLVRILRPDRDLAAASKSSGRGSHQIGCNLGAARLTRCLTPAARVVGGLRSRRLLGYEQLVA